MDLKVHDSRCRLLLRTGQFQKICYLDGVFTFLIKLDKLPSFCPSEQTPEGLIMFHIFDSGQ